MSVELDFSEENAVNVSEMVRLVKKRPIKNVAPGPDGIKNAIWKKVTGATLSHLASLFTLCLKSETFPSSWKRAILALIPKGAEILPDKIKARPICLLNEVGKIFERVIANRINEWMENGNDEARELSPNQFGFRRRRSTVDAVMNVQKITQNAIENGEFAIAVGIDIANAFNSIPWSKILLAMEDKGFPLYLRKIIASYLSDRRIIYRNSRGRFVSREVRAGVPQGSVLGPLLWNIAFDSVLRIPMEEGCRTMCYADDTLVIATSPSLFGAIVKANIQLARTMRHIEKLGLMVAEAKTEAVLFGNRRPFRMPTVRVGKTNILVGDSMRYLGVMIDGACSYRNHFRYAETKATKVVRALTRLMPNLRGPGERKRQLFATVVKSVVMYASPVWGEKFASAPDRVTRPLCKLQRSVAIRTVVAYRTVSYAAVTLLARSPPWKLEVTLRSRVYSRCQDLIRRNEFTEETEADVRNGKDILLMRQWDVLLNKPDSWGAKTINSIRPHLKTWLSRRHGDMNYYVTQMLSGHGSFGHFLNRIQKRETAECFHCAIADDTLEHTVFDCPSWESYRIELYSKLGLDIQTRHILEEIVEKILVNEENWLAFSYYAVSVLKTKEEEERRRETLSREILRSLLPNEHSHSNKMARISKQ